MGNWCYLIREEDNYYSSGVQPLLHQGGKIPDVPIPAVFSPVSAFGPEMYIYSLSSILVFAAICKA